MFEKGTQVVYGIHGVCNIVDIDIQTLNRKKVEFYVLLPVSQPQARFYVPTQNQAAVAKLRPVLTREELDALLRSEAATRDTWIQDENKRKLYYRELINSGVRTELICMVRSLHKHRTEQLAIGRKFHLSDENFLQDAEKLLSSEFSLVLGIEQNKVKNYIMNAFLDK